MYTVNKVLKETRERLTLGSTFVADFVGIPTENYVDIESFGEEIWQLSVLETVRLCVLCRSTPHDLLRGSGSGRFGSSETVIRQMEMKGMPTYFRERVDNWDALANETLWEASDLKTYLQDEHGFGQMPLQALQDLCELFQVSLMDVLTTYGRFGREQA